MTADRSAEGGDAGEEMSTQPELLAVLRLDCRRALSTVIRCMALRRRRKEENIKAMDGILIFG